MSRIDILKEVFSVTLNPSGNDKLYYHSEIQDENLDSLLIHLLSVKYSNSLASGFEYLVDSYKRARKLKIVEVADTIAGFGIMVFLDPLVFEHENSIDLQLFLESQADSSRGDTWDLIYGMATRAVKEDRLKELIYTICSSLNSHANENTLEVYMHLVSNPSIAETMSLIDEFSIPNTMSVIDVEHKTLLGPVFAVSPLGSEMPNSQVIALELASVGQKLFFIANKIIRTGTGPRKKLLEWLGKILDLNHKRVAFQGNTSSDGFLINILNVCLQLSRPFIDFNGRKIDKVNTEYFKMDPVYDILDETKIASDLGKSKLYYEERLAEEANFVSHIFYLTIGFLHYGLGGLIQSQSRLKRRIDDIQSKLEYFEQKKNELSDPSRAGELDISLRFLRDQLKTSRGLFTSNSAALKAPELSQQVLLFVQFLSAFLIRSVEPTHSYPQSKLKVLPDESIETPVYFQNMPEYFVEIIGTLGIFYARATPELFIRNRDNSRLVEFIILFLGRPNYISNPYVKAKFVELMFFGILEFNANTPGFFAEVVDNEELALKYLVHSLMQFYIDVERTGASSQFEDKFNTRYYISKIFRHIWKNHIYQTTMTKASQKELPFFVKFVALLLNDSTYLLDESLSKLTQIHNESEQGPPSPELTRQATSYIQLASETLNLLKLFTSSVPVAFTSPELVDRLAAMMDYNLVALAGPQCRDLKVANPEKYGFYPKILLHDLVSTFLNLSPYEEFVQAISQDGRSFDPAIFDRAHSILMKTGLLSPSSLAQFRKLKEDAVAFKNKEQQELEEAGDVPEEFLDPLLWTVMKNPVILPSSGVRIDLATIKSHLLSDQKDPFNRAPLKLEDVQEDLELKTKIEKFWQEKRNKNV